MKCPRCKTVNDNTRTICTKCGFYLYRNDSDPRTRMSKEQIAAMDRRVIKNKIKTVLKWTWRVIVFIVMIYWIIVIFLWASDYLGVSLG
ncbi:MAG: hypothetical protein J6U23_11655 [Clostridiales bacterium]|nr:hypothetical protein [Clostridiales bacterium]